MVLGARCNIFFDSSFLYKKWKLVYATRVSQEIVCLDMCNDLSFPPKSLLRPKYISVIEEETVFFKKTYQI